MKTIQQIIKEMDPIDIEKAYYAEYPIRLWEINNHKKIFFHSKGLIYKWNRIFHFKI